MATARPFAYNTGTGITGTTQVGDLAVGTPTYGFSASPQFWNGPDEDLGYVIAHPVSSGTQPTPVPGITAYLGFNRTSVKTDPAFITLAQYVASTYSTPQIFTTANEASLWLNANGFWTSLLPIVTSGLQLYLDAGTTASYPGTGTTWYDISGNEYNGTLISDPTFNSANSGSFIFNGVDEFVRVVSSGFFNISGNNFFADTGYAWTVSAWFKFPVSPVGTRTGNASFSILGQSGGIGGGETLTVYVNSATDNTYGTAPYYLMVGIRGTKTTISTGSMNTGVWNQVVVSWNGTSGRAYLNGADRGATNIGTVAIQTGQYFDVANTGDSGAPGDSTQQFEGNIATILVYDRALSAEEVTQNYNAQEERFG